MAAADVSHDPKKPAAQATGADDHKPAAEGKDQPKEPTKEVVAANLSQAAITPGNKGDLQIVHADRAKAAVAPGIHPVHLVMDGAHGAEPEAKPKPAEPAKPSEQAKPSDKAKSSDTVRPAAAAADVLEPGRLSPDAVKAAAHDIDEALRYRNLWGHGVLEPEVDRIRNILEPMTAADRKAVADSYEIQTRHTLQGDLKKTFGEDSENYKRLNGILQRRDGKSDEAGQIDVMVSRIDTAFERMAARNSLVSTAFAGMAPGVALFNAVENKRDERARQSSMTEIERTVGALTSSQIKELGDSTGRDFQKELRENTHLTPNEKQILSILFEGSDKRSGGDPASMQRALKLTDLAFETGNASLLKDTLQTSSQDTRDLFIGKGGLSRIDRTFRGDDRETAKEYATRGSVSLSYLIDGNNHWYHTNKDEISRLVENPADTDREMFVKGRQLADAGRGATTPEDVQALQFYSTVHEGLKSAGNARESADWEAKLAGDKLTDNLLSARSDGVIFGWGAKTDTNKLYSSVENLDGETFRKLKADPESVGRIDRALATFMPEQERTALMSKLKEKLSVDNFDDSLNLGHRTAKELLTEPDLQPADRLNGLINLSPAERQKISSDAKYQAELAGLGNHGLPNSLEQTSEKRLLAELKSGKPPDSLDKALAEGLGNANPAQLARLIEAGLKDDAGLRARLQNPTTEEDRNLSGNLHNLMNYAVDKAGFGDQSVPAGDGTAATIPGRYDEFIKPLFESGRMPVELKAQLEPDRYKRMQDILGASPEERARLLQNPPVDQTTKSFQDSVLGNGPDREILLNGLKQGKFDAADTFRMFVTAENSKQPTDNLKATLLAMTPAERQDLANRYFTKYGHLITDDVGRAIPDQDQYRFRELLSPTDVNVRQVALDTREEDLRHNSGADAWLSQNWDKSKLGAQEAQNQMDKYLREHATDIDKLNPQQKADFDRAVGNYQQALKNYIDSKGKFSEAVVDTGVAVVAVGSMVLTAGASSPLVAAIAVGTVAAPVTAAGRVATMSYLQGSDFDSSAGNVAKEAFKGYTAVALSGLTAEVVGLNGVVAVGDAAASTTAGAVVARAAAANISESVFKEGAQTTIAESVAGLTRQQVLAGSPEMKAKVAEITGKVLSDNATAAQREVVQRAIEEELKHNVTATVRDRVMNSLESYATNTTIATGGNVGTEIAATAAGFEDPKTLFSRMAESGIAAVAGGTLMHIGAEGGKGVFAILGKDARGLFAGEGTIIRHGDGNFSMVPEGQKYRFQSGDTIAQRPVAGMEQPRVRMESVDAESRRTAVRRGSVTEPGGAQRDVVFHPPEGGTFGDAGKTPAQISADRMGREELAAGLNKKIGFDSSYPGVSKFTTQVEGKPVTGFLQEDAGKPVKDELTHLLDARFGSTEHAETDLPKVFAENPQLRDQYANIVAERLVYGDRDINTSNITRGADGQLHNIDSGHAFGYDGEPVDSLHSYRKSLVDMGLLNAFSKEPIPEATRAKLADFANRYSTEDSITALATELKAPREQVAASVARARQLAQDGHFPTADHTHFSDPESIEMLRYSEKSRTAERAEADRLARERVPKDVDGRPIEGGTRDKLSSEWGSLSQPEIQASREAVARDFKDFKIVDGTGKASTVQDSFDHAVQTGVLDKNGERDLYTALALVREHYTSLRTNGQILPDQAANWTHTMGELSRVLQSAEANHFTPEETKLAMMASMFSDSAKYVDTPITKGNFFTHHLDGAISADLHNLGLSDAERNIVTNAILAHQISPPEFMGKLYYMRAKGTLASLPEGSPEKARLAELLDPAKSPYIGRSKDGMPTFSFIADAANRDAHLIPGQGYALNLNNDEQTLLRATGNENWHVPRDPATQPGFDTMPAAERERLQRLYRVSNGLLAGDNAQYATIDSAYKFVVIRGPGTFFQDPDVFHSLGTVRDSFDDAYKILSPVDQKLAAQNLEHTTKSLAEGGDVRARMDAAVKDQFGTTDVPFYGQKLTAADYPKLSPADQSKLNDLVQKAYNRELPPSEQAAAMSEAEALTGLAAPHAENYVRALRVKAIAARVLRKEASMNPDTVSDDFASVRGTTTP